MLSNKLMQRFDELDSKPKRTAEENTEYKFILEAYLYDLATTNPKLFEERFGQYKVDEATFKRVTGRDPRAPKN